MSRSLRVMVVEDEFIIADEIAAILEDSGHEVVGPFGSIEQAAARLSAADKPDCAILDANLRGMSSVPLAEKLRGLGVPICLCTGYRSDDLRGMFGKVPILQKPVNARALMAVIEAMLSSQDENRPPDPPQM
jgi:DNA-binding response OmpR family regulator